jgi:hypothetical protein
MTTIRKKEGGRERERERERERDKREKKYISTTLNSR